MYVSHSIAHIQVRIQHERKSHAEALAAEEKELFAPLKEPDPLGPRKSLEQFMDPCSVDGLEDAE